ncbi:MAG: helix-turn-helix transcriptional regulator [Pseudomonas sp.]
MLTLDNLDTPGTHDPLARERALLLQALDIDTLWQACAALVTQALPCHSCSLLSDIHDYQPRQGRHCIAAAVDEAPPATSLAVSAPYLATHPRVRGYTYSQIVSQDPLAAARLQAQNPAPGWREFIHLAFWNEWRLEAVLSIRIRAERAGLSAAELAFLAELYPILDAGLHRVRALESERIRHAAIVAPLQRLSPSERKVAGLVAQGLRNDDIAQRLCRSRKTIESQLSSAYRKLDLANRAQLVRLLAG